jgi:hypothetical protein
MVFLFGIVLFSRCYAFLFTGIPFFYIARYLAAKFGTYSWLSPYMSSLLWVDDSQLELTLFFFVISRELLIIR